MSQESLAIFLMKLNMLERCDRKESHICILKWAEENQINFVLFCALHLAVLGDYSCQAWKVEGVLGIETRLVAFKASD